MSMIRCKLTAAAAALVVAAATAAAQDRAFAIPAGWVTSPVNVKQAGEAGYAIRHPKVGLEMVYVPGGTFRMGSTAEELDHAAREAGVNAAGLQSEAPAHEVDLDPYWIGRTEVTVGQWRMVMDGLPPPDDQGRDRNTTGEDHPVIWTTWDEAQQFCQRLGLRLPTEAEWERACRGPENRVFPWGNEWDEKKCCNLNNQRWTNGVGFRTFPAGSFPEGASWCGALDMAGNLREWCADWFGDNYYAASLRRNPQGPADGGPWKSKVTRGGGYASKGPDNFRGAKRSSAPKDMRVFAVGVRCAL